MSFAVEARKVRDEALPIRHRVHAMSHCIEHYCPIGFEATRSYLESRVGPLRSGRALVEALDLIDESRRLRVDLMADYAARRRREKGAGQRRPGRGESTPLAPARRHGDEARAARFALDSWRAGRWSVDVKDDDGGPFVLGLMDSVRRGREVSSEDRTRLQVLLADLPRRIEIIDWDTDRVGNRQTWQLQWLAWQVAIALGDGPVDR